MGVRQCTTLKGGVREGGGGGWCTEFSEGGEGCCQLFKLKT